MPITTPLKMICEWESGLEKNATGSNYREIIERARTKIFSFNYPIYDNSHKKELETKIILHFFNREIGYETYGLWRLKLDEKMNLIMPYYNKLYQSEAWKLNPLTNVSLITNNESDENTTQNNTETDNRKINKTNWSNDNKNEHGSFIHGKETQNIYDSSLNDTSLEHTTNHTVLNGKTKTDNLNTYSDTPQSATDNLKAGKYLTNATIDDNLTKTDDITDITGDVNSTNNQTHSGKDIVKNTGTDKNNNHTDFTRNETENVNDDLTKNGNMTQNTFGNMSSEQTGYTGTTQQEMLMKYRESIINIDNMIIDELESLFIQLW